MVYWAGNFVEPASAVVSLLDSGYLVGDGVFATLRGYDGACFRPERHLSILARGAQLFGIELPMTLEQIAEIADEAARRTGLSSAYVRVTLTRGTKDSRPSLSVLARAMDVPPDDAYARGIPTVTVTPRRIPPACFEPTIKSTSYAAELLARREAESRGATEGIQLALDGSLACGTMSNLFVVASGEILTPSLASGCRAGVTREAVLEVARQNDWPVRETRLDPSIFEHADEAFFSSTRVECLPIATVDGRAVGRGTFTRTHALRERLSSIVFAETISRRRPAEANSRSPR